MPHETLQAFDEENNLIKEYKYWKVLVRNRNTTLGNCVLIIKEDIRAWGDVPAEANSELAIVVKELESSLKKSFSYDIMNYLMLMMKDPQVHFHVIPRYSSKREFAGLDWFDDAWPGAKINTKESLSQEIINQMKDEIKNNLF